MSETICPFCGKTNPADAEFCWSCQAHLLPSAGSGLPNDASPGDIAKWLAETGGTRSNVQDNEPIQENEPEWLARIHERMRWEKEQAQQAQDLIPKDSEPSANEIPDWLKESTPAVETSGVQSADDHLEPDSNLPVEPEQSFFGVADIHPNVPEEITHDTLPPINLNDLFRNEGTNQAEVSDDSGSAGIRPPRITGELSGYVKPFYTGEIKELLGEDEAAGQDGGELAAENLPAADEGTRVSPQISIPADEEAAPHADEKEITEPDLPDWIKELGAEVPSEPGADVPSESAGQSPTFSFTDLSAEKTEISSERSDIAKQDDGIPSWLANLATLDQIPNEVSIPVFKGGDEELISSAAQEEIPLDNAEIKDTPPAVEAAQLEPATLPPWMHSMRPIESALPDNIQSLVQGSATMESLGDIEDVLPSPVVPTEYSKPPVYEDQLNVTDRQRMHAELLQSLLSSEKTPQTASIKIPADRSRFSRILFSILFIGIILVVLFFGMNIAPQPSNFPSGSVSLASGVANLPDNALVLIVADFEPAYLGEMTSAASPVMKHLISKNSRLALLSTNATTPVLIETMVREAAQSQISYLPDQKMVNLGYLPAGATGLQNFATSAKLTLAYAWDGSLITESPVIDESFALTSFHAVIVITDNYETGKLWLEQITPRMGGIPTWMVSSQQSAQLLSPYLESGQLKGLVSGMEGGLLYAQQIGIPQANPSVWSAYQVGITLALLIIVLGGVIQIIASRTKRQQSKPAEVNDGVE